MGVTEIKLIPVAKIAWRDNVRKTRDPEAVERMAASIRVHGVKQAVGCIEEGDGYRGVWGQTRCLAATLAALELIPAMVLPAPRDEAEMLEAGLLENVARDNLNPMDQSDGLAKLIELSGLPAGEVARRVGMNPGAASKSLKLQDLLPPVRQMVREARISAACGYELAGVSDPAEQLRLAELAASGLTRDQLSGIRKGRKRDAAAPVAGRARSAGTRLTVRLSGDRTVTFRGGTGSVETVIQTLESVLAEARKARGRGLSVPTFAKLCADQSRRPAEGGV